MEDQKRYDWEPSVREIGNTALLPECAWQEEWQIAPDCESFAAVSALDDGTFTLRRNDALWETRSDKMYNCQFAPDGRLTALSQSDGEWSLVVDDEEGEEKADYLWGTRFNAQGTIAVPMQTGMEYGMLVNGAPWEQLYTAATDFVLSEGGNTAAVVQIAGLGQADLEGFRKGIYTVAVNGEAWEESYLNAWSPCFDKEGHRVACTVRVTPYEYTISINGQRWGETYPCAWEPVFEPQSGDVIAPIRKEGKWGLARNGSLFWKPAFAQCWTPKAASAEGQYVWAVVAPSYGAFTVACNATPWSCRFPSVTDLTLSPDGKRAAATTANSASWWTARSGTRPLTWRGPRSSRPRASMWPPRSGATANTPSFATASPSSTSWTACGTRRSARTVRSCCSARSRTACSPATPCGCKTPRAKRNSS